MPPQVVFWPACVMKSGPPAGTLEHGGELEEHADLASEREDVEGADVGAVEEDGGGGGLPEAVERAEERGHAAAAGAHDQAAGHVQVDPAQDLFTGGVRQAAQPPHPYLGGGEAVVHDEEVLPDEVICLDPDRMVKQHVRSSLSKRRPGQHMLLT
jgi:hypothetical protein